MTLNWLPFVKFNLAFYIKIYKLFKVIIISLNNLTKFSQISSLFTSEINFSPRMN